MKRSRCATYRGSGNALYLLPHGGDFGTEDRIKLDVAGLKVQTRLNIFDTENPLYNILYTVKTMIWVT